MKKRIIIIIIIILLIISCKKEIIFSKITDQNLDIQEYIDKLVEAAEYGDLQTVKEILHIGNFVDSYSSNGELALVQAGKYCYMKNYYEIFKLLIENGADVNKKEKSSGNTALIGALQFYYDEDRPPKYKTVYPVIKLLVKKGAEVNLKNKNLVTPLHKAAYLKKDKNKDKIIKFLISKGSEINAIDINGNTPIVYSIWQDDLKIINYLLKNGADLNIKNNNDEYVYYSALRGDLNENRLEIAKYLLENIKTVDKDIFVKNIYYQSGFGKKYYYIQNKKIIEILVGKGALINAKDKNWTILHYALEDKNEEFAKYIIEKGFKLDDEKINETLLKTAFENNLVDIIDTFLKKGMDLKNISNNEIVSYIAEFGSKEMLDLFIKNGLKIDPDNFNDDDYPLHIAIENSKIDLVKAFIELGFDVNFKDDWGESSMHKACSTYNSLEIVKLLYSNNANINLNNIYNEKPIVDSFNKNQFDVIDFLLEKGAIIDKNIFAQTFIINIKYINILLNKGADINSANDDGITLLMKLTDNNGYFDIFDFAVKNGADVNRKDKNGNNVFHHYIFKNYTLEDGFLDIFLKNIKNINEKNNNGETVIAGIIAHKNLDILKKILKKSPDLNIVDNNGLSYLSLAVFNNDFDMCKLLIDNGIDLHIKTEFGETALYYAVDKQYFNIAKLIVEKDKSTIYAKMKWDSVLKSTEDFPEFKEYLKSKNLIK